MNGKKVWDERLLELRVRCPKCGSLLHTGVKANEKDWHEKDYSGTLKCDSVIGRTPRTAENPIPQKKRCNTTFNWAKKDVKNRSST